jgi:stress response protein YsnF
MAMNSPDHVPDGRIVLPVIAEEVHGGVRQVDTGSGVRLHKTVTEQPCQIDQALLRDAIEVKRVPVDRVVALSEAPAARQEGDTFIVPVLEEILVVEKRLRIKEEVHITRTARQEQYADTVVLRTEHVEVERFGNSPNSAVPASAVTPSEVNPTNGGTHHATHTRSSI